MSEVVVKIDTRALDNMIRGLDGNADRAMTSIANQVSAETQHIIQVKHIIDTGALLNSIHVEKIGQAHYWILDGVEYGIYNELGTWKMAARPFMVPATEKVAADVSEAFGEVL